MKEQEDRHAPGSTPHPVHKDRRGSASVLAAAGAGRSGRDPSAFDDEDMFTPPRPETRKRHRNGGTIPPKGKDRAELDEHQVDDTEDDFEFVPWVSTFKRKSTPFEEVPLFEKLHKLDERGLIPENFFLYPSILKGAQFADVREIMGGEHSGLKTRDLVSQRALARALNRRATKQVGNPASEKPSITDLQAMYEAMPKAREEDIAWADTHLDDGKSHERTPLIRSAWKRRHLKRCARCQEHAQELDPDCYFHFMDRVIARGYVTPITTTLPANRTPPYKSYTDFEDEDADRMAEALELGHVKKLSSDDKAHVVNALVRVVKEKFDDYDEDFVAQFITKIRIAIDMDAVNTCVEKWPFSFMGVQDLLEILEGDDILLIMDMAKAFHHIPLARWGVSEYTLEDGSEVTGVRTLYGFEHKGELYEYVRMPFGIAVGPALFSMFSYEFMLSVETQLDEDAATTPGLRRKPGTRRGVVYIDDMAFRADSVELSEHIRQRVQEIADEVGLEIADKKTQGPWDKHGVPLKVAEFLGLEVNTKDRTLSITPHRRDKLLKELDMINAAAGPRGEGWVDQKLLRSLVGRLGFVSQVVTGGRAYSSRIWAASHKDPADDGSVQITNGWRDLKWWRARFADGNILRVRIWPSHRRLIPFQTDASGSGAFGGFSGADCFWGDYKPTPEELAPYMPPKEGVATTGDNVPEMELGALVGIAHSLCREPNNRGSCLVALTDQFGNACLLNSLRGASRTPQAALLRALADTLNEYDCELVAIWNCRELGNLPDALTHLERDVKAFKQSRA